MTNIAQQVLDRGWTARAMCMAWCGFHDVAVLDAPGEHKVARAALKEGFALSWWTARNVLILKRRDGSILPTGDSLPQELQRPRVLIADDHAGVRTAVSRLLAPSCDIVACVVDIAALFDAAVRLRPDVVLLDLSLPGELNGFDACRRLRLVAPEVKVVALTAHHDEDIRRGADEAGCSGFVWKPRASSELLRTIQAVLAGTSRSADADTA